jgi:hypothetical protein
MIAWFPVRDSKEADLLSNSAGPFRELDVEGLCKCITRHKRSKCETTFGISNISRIRETE